MLEETELDPDVLIEVRKSLIALIGVRKLDETPTALSLAFEAFANELISQAAKASTWAEAAQLPLPDDFITGSEFFQTSLAINNPILRVKELHTARTELSQYAAAIRNVDTYTQRSGRSFTEMRELVRTLQSVAFRFPEQGACNAFLKNYAAAFNSASLTDPEVWKDLLNSKAVASLEMDQTLNRWKKEAGQMVKEVVAQLPQLHIQSDTDDEELKAAIANKLEAFLEKLESENQPAYLANAVDRARQAIEQFYRALDEARARQTQSQDAPMKELVTIRLTDVTHSIRIQSEEQWEEIRDRLDQSIRDALASDKEVNIT